MRCEKSTFTYLQNVSETLLNTTINGIRKQQREQTF